MADFDIGADDVDEETVVEEEDDEADDCLRTRLDLDLIDEDPVDLRALAAAAHQDAHRDRLEAEDVLGDEAGDDQSLPLPDNNLAASLKSVSNAGKSPSRSSALQTSGQLGAALSPANPPPCPSSTLAARPYVEVPVQS